MDETTNENVSETPQGKLREPDAHGQAAMLLVESLIHGLVARSIISVEDAVEIVTVAADVKTEIASDLGDSPATVMRSLTLLEAISASLQLDVPDDPGISGRGPMRP